MKDRFFSNDCARYYMRLLFLYFQFCGTHVVGQQANGYAILVGVPSTVARCKLGEVFDNRATLGVSNDVEKIKKLLGQSKFKEQNLTCLTTSSKTTADEILQTLRKVSVKALSGDLVVFYFSGHGDTLQDINGDELLKKDGILVASDRCIIDDELRPIWNGFRAGVRLVMIVDACHAGGSYDFSFLEHSVGDVSARSFQVNNSRNQPISKSSVRAKPEIQFRNEILFNQTRKSSFGSCLEIAKDAEPKYQMIYISATHDISTTGGGSGGSSFTNALYRSIRTTDADVPTRKTYREILEKLDTCPSRLSYAEVGSISQNFIKNHFFQIK